MMHRGGSRAGGLICIYFLWVLESSWVKIKTEYIQDLSFSYERWDKLRQYIYNLYLELVRQTWRFCQDELRALVESCDVEGVGFDGWWGRRQASDWGWSLAKSSAQCATWSPRKSLLRIRTPRDYFTEWNHEFRGFGCKKLALHTSWNCSEVQKIAVATCLPQMKWGFLGVYVDICWLHSLMLQNHWGGNFSRCVKVQLPFEIHNF